MTLALIAGRGALPAAVVAALDTPPLICAYEGFAPTGLTADLTFRLETLGSLLVRLGERGVTQVCFAGGLDRPTLDPTKLDAETAPLVPLFQQALAKGDDGALRVVLDIFEKTGFKVRAAHEIVPGLLAEGRVYSNAWPDARMRSDAEVGAAHIAAIGPQDIGQACIIMNGKLIATEDAKGTDHLISRLAPIAADKRAVLFKGPKPQQSRLVDLPTIGPATLENAAKAGFVGVVIDAGDVIILDAEACTQAADAHGLVLWSRTGT